MSSNYWRPILEQRISRRRMLAATGAGAAGLVIASACGSGKAKPPASEPGTTPTPGSPVYGGRFKAGSTLNIDTLDPHLSITGGVEYIPRIYNVLVARSALKPEFEFNDLAETLEQPDDTTWIFGIRPGVRIAPNELGVPERDMDASDAYETFERIMHLDQANAAAFVNQWFASHEASADGTTYTVRTPSPYAWFIARMGFFINNIAPKEMLAGDSERLRTSAVGGGPFSVAAGGYKQGESLALERNPNYYRTDPNNTNAQLPYVDGIDVSIFADRATWRTAFLSKQTHNYTAENSVEADELLGRSDVDLYLGSTDPVQTFISVTMNVERPPFDIPEIRKAVSAATNRQQYIDLVYAGDAKANGLVHWPQGEYALPPDELEQLQPFDPELSKTLIAQAGFDVPLEINVMYPANADIDEHSSHLPIFIEQMKAAGFKLNQDPQDFGTWADNYTNKNYDISLALNQVYETPELPLDFQHSAGPAGDHIYSNGLEDPEIDAAIEAAKTVTDHDQLVQAIHDVQRQIYAAGPVFLPLVCPFSRILYHSFVKNIPSGLGSVGELVNDWWLEA